MKKCNNYFIHNAFVVNKSRVFSADVLIQNGLICQIMTCRQSVEDIQMADDTVFIDATGKYLLPGLIDEHVHFREPGLTDKADMTSESKAALAGGVCSVMDMPNVIPPTTTVDLLNERFELAKQKMYTNYSFYLALTNTNWHELEKIDKSRVCGLKLFLGSSTGNLLVDDEKVLDTLFAKTEIPLAIHAEDELTIRQNMERYKKEYGSDIPMEYHRLIRSQEACYKASKSAVERARKFNTQLHLLHLTTAQELELLSKEYPLITAEVCPSYLSFDSDDYQHYGTLIKCNPSIKTPQDKAALLQAVADKTIATIGSDHAPHLWQEKQKQYVEAPSGIPVVQHMLPVLMDLFLDKKIKIQTIVELCCHNPAKIFNIDKRGFIQEGYFADLVLVDINRPTTVNKNNCYYKCKWSPFDGKTFRTTVEKTFVNGVLAYDNGYFAKESAAVELKFNR